MTRFLVAVVDGAKARFLTLEPLSAPELESGPDLIEHCELLNPAIEMAGQDLWANTKTGRNRGSGSRGHSYDDHRGNHLVEFERRFAQAIDTKMASLLAQYDLNTLVLVAEPQILGILRENLTSANHRIQAQEVAKDLCRMTSRQLHEYLAQKGLLPPRQVAMAASRSRSSS
ncbi:host attachment protein [Nodosilinea sp. LEGE 07088]|uniref:host attachment protein n=1 Tax=Nodosilinea sp. LEGE 07088 TaxID=2777968 RepID=UPI0018809BB5|nr:host attachment protein [Nodosilinea sp. LEGE 07088]MBE9138117.1 host attachment protein [Nodosilinea sp. LEGE 07088]